MDISLVIDHRETKLKELFKTQEVQYENLEFGDFQIKIQDHPLLVIERKTLADLAASIVDGRYKNQKIKLLQNIDSNNLYYIIEGSFDFDTQIQVYMNGIPKSTIVSCMINTMIRDNIKVFVTKDIQDTYHLISSIYKRIKDDPNKYLVHNENVTKVCLKSKVKSKIECFENQLCQIPDISSKTAQAISKIYPSFKDLYNALNNKTDDEKLKVLKEITIQDTKGKSRKISEKVVKNIIHYV